MLGGFDLEHLQAVHAHLFQDVYPWAGTLRTVDMSKGPSTFAPFTRVAEQLDKALQRADVRDTWTASTTHRAAHSWLITIEGVVGGGSRRFEPAAGDGVGQVPKAQCAAA